MRNWTALNMVKLAVLVDALNRESGALDEAGAVARPDLLLDDIRLLRGRTDLLEMPAWPAAGARPAASLVGPADGAVPPGVPAASPGASSRAAPLQCPPPITTPAAWAPSR